VRFALVNPPWNFSGSIYFGCREPHLPLEYGYAAALLEQHGHEAIIVDGQVDGLSRDEVRRRVTAAAPDVVVITTAPSYLFWRCAPPELRVPLETMADLADIEARFVVVGPHASTTPGTTLRKLGADVAVMGECEDILPLLATREWRKVPSIAWREGDTVHVQGGPHASDMASLPALRWPDEVIRRSRHHHHRFDAAPTGPGAEVEATRGCPYHCTFCAKDNFRNQFRKRQLATVVDELDALIAQGVEYVYFIDEIFLPQPALLDALAARPIRFGVQMRIDLWTPELLDRLGAAGCVSIEAGVESISEEGRRLLDKNSRMTTAGFTERLIRARRTVPFVQANLLEARVYLSDEL
jgi:B12-binding domain/radical SAM domain protein of rhizo-twelve system